MLNFPLIEVQGAPEKRGFQHGRASSDRLNRTIEIYKDAFQQAGVSWEEAKEIARQFLDSLTKYDETYIEEMEGIARGGSVDFDTILTINTRTEILFWRSPETPVQFASTDECTGIIATPDATADQRILHALNWDWRADCVDCSIILRIRSSDDRPDILTFTEAGLLARSGLNQAGLGLTGNGLQTSTDYGRIGVPIPCIRRKILEADNLAKALTAVIKAERAFSNNLMISTSDGEAINLEVTPEEIFWLHPENGLLIHANHFKSQTARLKVTDRIIMLGPDTILRDQRTVRALTPKIGSITLKDVQAALKNKVGAPFSVCRPVNERRSGYWSATVATIIILPEDRKMLVEAIPSEGHGFQEFGLG